MLYILLLRVSVLFWIKKYGIRKCIGFLSVQGRILITVCFSKCTVYKRDISPKVIYSFSDYNFSFCLHIINTKYCKRIYVKWLIFPLIVHVQNECSSGRYATANFNKSLICCYGAFSLNYGFWICYCNWFSGTDAIFKVSLRESIHWHRLWRMEGNFRIPLWISFDFYQSMLLHHGDSIQMLRSVKDKQSKFSRTRGQRDSRSTFK